MKQIDFKKITIVLILINLILFINAVPAFAGDGTGTWDDAGNIVVHLQWTSNNDGTCTIRSTNFPQVGSVTASNYYDAKTAYYLKHNELVYGIKPSSDSSNDLHLNEEQLKTINYELSKFTKWVEGIWGSVFSLFMLILILKNKSQVIALFFASSAPQVRHRQIMAFINTLLKLLIVSLIGSLGQGFIPFLVNKYIELRLPTVNGNLNPPIYNFATSISFLINCVTGIAVLTGAVAFIWNFQQLQINSGNPTERTKSRKNLLFVGILMSLFLGSNIVYHLIISI